MTRNNAVSRQATFSKQARKKHTEEKINKPLRSSYHRFVCMYVCSSADSRTNKVASKSVRGLFLDNSWHRRSCSKAAVEYTTRGQPFHGVAGITPTTRGVARWGTTETKPSPPPGKTTYDTRTRQIRWQGSWPWECRCTGPAGSRSGTPIWCRRPARRRAAASSPGPHQASRGRTQLPCLETSERETAADKHYAYIHVGIHGSIQMVKLYDLTAKQKPLSSWYCINKNQRTFVRR